jgi:tetratricopeptide (TPR) repeat protein
MAFQGEVGAIGLADVFGNIAANSLQGFLHVTSEKEQAWLAFDGGQLSGFSRGTGKAVTGEGVVRTRSPLKAEDAEALIKKKRRSRKSWPDFLAGQESLDADQFRQMALNDLVDGAVEAFFWSPARFEFHDGAPPEGLFDPELGVTMDVNSLLMEAARRRDHWELIRKVVSSPEDVFAKRRPDPPGDGVSEFQKRVFALCTGLNSIASIEQHTRATRFQVFDAICELARAQLIRPLTSDEMVRLAEEHGRAGRTADAIRLFKRSLETEHANSAVRERLAETYAKHGDTAKAAGEYKILAHRAAEAGDLDRASELIRKAVGFAPDDIPAREKLIETLRAGGRKADASTEALKLAVLARRQVLHDRALAALDVALEANPGLKEAAELRVDTLLALGRKTEAVRQLMLMAGNAKNDDAEIAYLERAAASEPARADLKQAIQDIKTGRRVARRKFWRRLMWGAAFTLILALIGGVVTWEMRARLEMDGIRPGISMDLVRGEYVQACDALKRLADTHRFTWAGRKALEERRSIRDAAIPLLERNLVGAQTPEESRRWQDQIDALRTIR